MRESILNHFSSARSLGVLSFLGLCLASYCVEGAPAEPAAKHRDKALCGGTTYLLKDFISKSDPSLFVNVTDMGRRKYFAFDRRVAKFASIDAFCFKVNYKDQTSIDFFVNVEFGSLAAAAVEVDKYGRILGQIPNVLRKGIKKVTIHRGDFPFGGADGSVLIHTDRGEKLDKGGVLEETLVHEATHAALDPIYKTSALWARARIADGTAISQYAIDNMEREDMAESFLAYLAVRYNRQRTSGETLARISKIISHRITFYDNLSLDVSPLGKPSIAP